MAQAHIEKLRDNKQVTLDLHQEAEPLNYYRLDSRQAAATSAQLRIRGLALDPKNNVDQYAVYGLVDPRNPNEIKYVGVSNVPYKRLLFQIYYCVPRKTSRAHETLVSKWIRKLLAEGLIPELVVIEQGIDKKDRIAARRRYHDKHHETCLNVY